MTGRSLIVVDTETTGLDPEVHVPFEIAAVHLDTGSEIRLVLPLSSSERVQADPAALAINWYYERRLFAKADDYDTVREGLEKLWDMLTDNTLGGCNPRFDAAMLHNTFRAWDIGDGWEPWHHRLADISAITAVMARRELTNMPGLPQCCEFWDVINQGPHTAAGDALATADCFAAYLRTADAWGM